MFCVSVLLVKTKRGQMLNDEKSIGDEIEKYFGLVCKLKV